MPQLVSDRFNNDKHGMIKSRLWRGAVVLKPTLALALQSLGYTLQDGFNHRVTPNAGASWGPA